MFGSVNRTITFSNNLQLIKDISRLYLSEEFSDVVLVVGEERYHAHKFILSVRSDYFHASFAEDPENKKNEIAITDATDHNFLDILRYIYTAEISDDILDLHMLTVAYRYLIEDLEVRILSKLKSNMSIENVCSRLNTSNQFDFEELRYTCHSFLDSKAAEFLSSDHFNELSPKSLINLLQRDEFAAPEIEIFKAFCSWHQVHNSSENLLFKCVRLPLVSVADILSTVWPSGLVKCEDILPAIAEIVNVKPKSTKQRALQLVAKNTQCPMHNAELISGTDTSGLLTGNRDKNKFASVQVDGQSGFTIKLAKSSFLNHIQMMLFDGDSCNSSYYIEVSLDQKQWTRIIDFSRYPCRSLQDLYFEAKMLQYINIVGTENTAHTHLRLVYVEAYFRESIPRLRNGITYPDSNVATPEKGAIVIQGKNPQFLLNGDTTNYDGTTGYTYHVRDQECIMIQLAQPFMVSSMKLLLWDKDNRSYKYAIETSVNKKDWEIAVDRRNQACRSWQLLSFNDRAVVFIKIIGTHNTANVEGVHCVHFECPAENEEKHAAMNLLSEAQTSSAM